MLVPAEPECLTMSNRGARRQERVERRRANDEHSDNDTKESDEDPGRSSDGRSEDIYDPDMNNAADEVEE